MQFIIEQWRNGLEIFLLYIAIYYGYKSFKKTKGAPIFVALSTIIVVVLLLAYFLHLPVISWIVSKSVWFFVILLTVIFQPELRNILAKLGSKSMFYLSDKKKVTFIEQLSEVLVYLSNHRIGALFAFEKEVSLQEYADTGILLQANFSQELVLAIFNKQSNLHDGGLIIHQNKIYAAGCIFPVSSDQMIARALGLRHRAAVGISQATDAVTIAVSEETGKISITYGSTILQEVTIEKLTTELNQVLSY